MKKIVLLGALGLLTTVYADHKNLDSVSKLDFVTKRLEMMKESLKTKQRELLMLEGSINALPDSSSKLTVIKPPVAQLKKEIQDLEKNIPIMENSLNGLRK